MFTLATLMALVALELPAADYFVRATGDDQRSGLTTDAAWSSIGRVRAHAAAPGFRPGDRILFAGGETFACTTADCLYIAADVSYGTAAAPITIGSYGSGRATIRAMGCSAISIWGPPNVRTALGWIIRDLDLVGDDRSSAGTPTVGIGVWNGNAGVMDVLRIEQVAVSGFAGDGISLGRSPDGSRLTNVAINHVVAHGNRGLRGQQRPTGSGIVVGGTHGALIERCVAYDNGVDNTFSAGPCGIWCWDSAEVLIQSCEAYAQKTSGGDGNGFDIDGGCSKCVIQYCYSHDNEGPGYLLAQFDTAGDNGGNAIRFNISQNDVRKGWWGAITVWGATSNPFGFKDSHISNNTVYVSPVGPAAKLAGKEAVAIRLAERFSGIIIRNNLVVLDGAGLLAVESPTGALDLALFQNDCWWNQQGPVRFAAGGVTYPDLTAWRATGQERCGALDAGCASDPQLEHAGAGGTVGIARIDELATLVPEYRLRATSPLLGRGMDLTQPPVLVVPADSDFYGNPLRGSVPGSIGACSPALPGRP